MIHERREEAVDADLIRALREYELKYEELSLPTAADTDEATPAPLQAFHVLL